MTPKEKAIDLVAKFNYSYDEENKRYIFHQDIEESKRSALIAFDEILKNTHTNVFTRYWQEVKQEINLL